MTTYEGTHRAARKTRRATEAVITVVGVIVAIATGVLILTLTGASTTHRTAQSHPSSASAPLVRFHGTGAPPTARTTQLATGRNSNPANPAEHFYGLQP
jgi:hypothetical protein